jgi:hypothetical protein
MYINTKAAFDEESCMRAYFLAFQLCVEGSKTPSKYGLGGAERRGGSDISVLPRKSTDLNIGRGKRLWETMAAESWGAGR